MAYTTTHFDSTAGSALSAGTPQPSSHLWSRDEDPLPEAPSPQDSNEPKRIGLFGQFGCGNSGNDGSLESMLIFLRRQRPDADLLCICPSPEPVETTYGIPALRIGRPAFRHPAIRALDRLLLGAPRVAAAWVYTIRAMRKVDLLMVPGTGILDDFSTGPWGMPYALFRWCIAARLCRTKIAFVSVGAGPIGHPISRWLMRTAARVAHYRSYRDTVSRDFMKSLGSDVSADPVFPDIAFKLPVPRPMARVSRKGMLRVGVGIMNYRGWIEEGDLGAAIYGTYLRKITAFVLWLLDQGHNVRLLTGDKTDRGAVEDVLKVVTAERTRLPPGRIVAEPTTSLHELMRQISDTDAVVATRFHNVVSALMLGKPTISLGYAKKNDALLGEMGLSEFCQEIEKLDVGLLREQFLALVAVREDKERTIRRTALEYREKLDRQDTMIAARFLSETAL